MAVETTRIPDGTYFLSPEGGAWLAARFRGGRLVAATEESNAGTHAAANDRWAGVVPGEDDPEVDDEATAAAVVRAVMGDDTDPHMVFVSRQGPESRD